MNETTKATIGLARKLRRTPKPKPGASDESGADPLSAVPEPPADLPQDARRFWVETAREMIAQRTLYRATLHLLAVYAAELARYNRLAAASAAIAPLVQQAAREGRTLRDPNERALVLSAGAIRMLANALGLTPQSFARRRLPPREKRDPWLDFK